MIQNILKFYTDVLIIGFQIHWSSVLLSLAIYIFVALLFVALFTFIFCLCYKRLLKRKLTKNEEQHRTNEKEEGNESTDVNGYELSSNAT